MKADNTELLNEEIIAANILRKQLEDSFGEEDPIVKDTIEGETNLHEVMQKVIEDIGETGALIEGLKKYQDKIEGRKQRLSKRIDFMKTLLKVAMQAGNLGKTVQFPSATLTLKNTPDKADYFQEADIPTEFFVSAEPKLSKDLVKKRLKENKAKLNEFLDKRIAEEFPELKKKEEREAKREEVLDSLTEDELRPFQIPGAQLINDGPTIQIRVL